MASHVWQVIDKVWCDRMGQQADLLEERVFPADVLPDTEASFQVRARKCSLGQACNLAGYSCRWAYNNPNYDPFA